MSLTVAFIISGVSCLGMLVLVFLLIAKPDYFKHCRVCALIEVYVIAAVCFGGVLGFGMLLDHFAAETRFYHALEATKENTR